MSQIRFEKTSKVFGKITVIPPLDLEIGKGEFVVFVGPSGSGKSTLLRLIAGLEDASGGKISIEGKDVTRVPCGDRGLAMVFQSCPSSNDLRLPRLWKNGVSGSVCALI
ncbi:hypothetical protein RvVAT039_pl06480 (plasmid) [Agrobacterium vitis]|nr:hypothetical protein BBL07_11425 [Agrobacterium vitis]BCH67815.1 hypothetical protein RvVAT039_pl06480 [Agrobacterium vitis]